MSEFKKHLKEFAQKELELSGFDQTDFGKTTLTLLDNLADLSKEDPARMKDLLNLISRLIDKKVIAPLTEDDFPETNDQFPEARCQRYPYAYRTLDGKYWDDRAIAFQLVDEPNSNKMYLYQSENKSKQEIKLPYYPVETIKVIEKY